MRDPFRTLAVAMLGSVMVMASDQTQPGAGNGRAEEIGAGSALVHSALEQLKRNVRGIKSGRLREATLDGLGNRMTCVVHRANLAGGAKRQIIQQLVREDLLNETGAAMAGVFPPVLDDGSACPHVALSFEAAPGSDFGGHHSFPGGLAVHEMFNQESAIRLAAQYRRVYAGGISGAIDEDVILAAPVWHDWGKMLVFQWNADGTEFEELSFGGTGKNDKFGDVGDSRTGAHHIISLAEAMARGLPPLLVITQASAHAAPTLGNEFKVVNWLRAAAILARIDPVTKGYLAKDAAGKFELPAVKMKNVNATDFIEYQIDNLSDADFVNAIPAARLADMLLQKVAPQFGYDPAIVAAYNNRFRNVVLSRLSAEGIELKYDNLGLEGLITEIKGLQRAKVI
ncbi:MAG: hypothetical protein M3Y24_04485 [Acidobacteriota bacterium]|nr:hypothetical protein [Acidobacteriota bacterium]